MIEKVTTVTASGTNPYENIALEHFLLQNVEENEVILYVWQNEKTVVIGKNQNCYAECKLDKLKEDGGYLARRLSGGGAVYHDVGNINFTFIATKNNYDVERQTRVILNAVRAFGVNATKTGRNDIEFDGRKFSGNAFYAANNKLMHHGTLLLQTDIAMLSHYLTVKTDKLQSHGVKSVKSRVVNLGDINSDITPKTMATMLVREFEDMYGKKSAPIDKLRLNSTKIQRLCDKYSSDEWCKNKQRAFTCTLNHRYSWGAAELCFEVSEGKIKSAVLYTDALNSEISSIISKGLKNVPYNKKDIAQTFLQLCEENEEIREILQNLCELSSEI